MATVTFREAERNDAIWFAEHLREADRREIIASTGQYPLVGLTASIAMGNALTGELDGEPAALIGMPIISSLPVTGVPWMMGTDKIEEHPVPVARASAEIVERWGETVALMVNYVDSRNRRAVEWLQWLGFTIEEARPYGPFDVPFHRFFKVS